MINSTDINIESLRSILNEQRRYKQEWEQIWKETEPKLINLREAILTKNLTVDDIRSWKDDLPRSGSIRNIFRYVIPPIREPQTLFENNRFKEMLKEINEINDFEKCSELFIKAVNDNTIPSNIATISTWWAIFKPQMFMPISREWVEGSVGNVIISGRLAERINVDREKIGNPEYAVEFIKTVRAVAQKIGIRNMIEVAYYFSKYDPSIKPPINIKDFFNSKSYNFPDYLTAQFYTALKTKGFVILSGLSGTGKTKIALEFAKLLSQTDTKNYIFISVRPDWRDSKPLLGYYNPLNGKYYETPLLNLILRAIKDYEQNKEKAQPYFIIFDEMNLAHVEYYFADFLSVLESGRDDIGFTIESIKLHNVDEVERDQRIPKEIKLPPNLYVIGTVNIDETTYMFSPKVLDRAFTIEFHDVDLTNYPPSEIESEENIDFSNLRNLIIEDLRNNGNFLTYADKKVITDALHALQELKSSQYWQILQNLNKALEPYDLHFGYRVIDEIALFFKNAKEIQEKGIVSFENDDEIFDSALLMKILPKFHGNRKKLEKPLLIVLKIAKTGNLDESDIKKDTCELFRVVFNTEQYDSEVIIKNFKQLENYKFKYTAKKVLRMLRQIYESGFTSFS